MISKHLIRLLFLIAVVCGILSQLPFLLQTQTAEIFKAIWILPLVFCIFLNPRSFLSESLRFFYFFVFIFISYCLLANVVTNNEYFGTDIKNILISLMVFTISYSTWYEAGNQRFVNNICLFSLLATLILAYYIYRDYLAPSSIDATIYAYAAKNSAAQILLNTVLFLYCFKSKKKWLIIAITSLSAILIAEIFILRSRATLACVAFALIYFLFASDNRQFKRWIWFIFILSIFYLIYNPQLSESLYSNIILANRDSTDLNNISSGRIDLISIFWDKFRESAIWGNGNLYIDCFPVSILAQYGVLGFVIIVVFIYKIFRSILFMMKYNSRLYTVSFLLFSTILINSLFEAQPPFGPGMKCFMVWLSLGFSFAEFDKQKLTC